MAETQRILVADKLASEGLEYLKSFEDVEVDVQTGLSEDELARIVGDYDGLIVRSGVEVTETVLANPGRLKVVARAGVGVDNIDLDAATANGVLAMNSAEASTITTAEHAFALLMALARNVGPAHKTMKEGGWDRKKFVGHQLAGKTLGVVGFGRVGRTLAERALAFEMDVVAFDPVYNAETALDGRVKMYRDLDAMLPHADILSLHVPLNDQTQGMMNGDRFARCKDGVLLVNASRGPVVDVPSLLEALDSDKCGGAALDVFETEPLPEEDPLRSHPKVLLTPHLGASTKEAQEAVATKACEQAVEYLRGEGLRGAVNAPGVRLDLDSQSLRFVDLTKRMATLLAPLCEGGIDEVTVTIAGSELSSAANTIERMALVPLLRGKLELPVNLVNAQLIAEQRGIRARSVIEEQPRGTPRVTIEVRSGSQRPSVAGSVFADGQPRVLEINGFHMDMVPAGPMAMLFNEDRPGIIGLVGSQFGAANANIADMALSRSGRGRDALMVLKLDQPPAPDLIEQLRQQPGILKVVTVQLPPLEESPPA